jgi:hypothetical protein
MPSLAPWCHSLPLCSVAIEMDDFTSKLVLTSLIVWIVMLSRLQSISESCYFFQQQAGLSEQMLHDYLHPSNPSSVGG